MKSLVELQTEIQSLQKQAATLKTREFAKTVTEIVRTMQAFGITLGQLKAALKKAPAKAGATPAGRGAKRGPKPKAGAARKAKVGKKQPGTRQPAAIKFRGPGGEAWSGRGKTPNWLKTLVAAGRKVDEFKL
jgi:DNA-binding protein H-NS